LTRVIDFSNYSSIKIGSKKELLLIDEIDDYSHYTMVGNATNLLVSDEAKNLAILSKNFDYIEMKDGLLYVGARCKNQKLFRYAMNHNIKNFEFLSHLPGSIGGSVKMNAGLKSYEIFNNLIAIKTSNGYIKKEDIEFGYRFCNISDIIFEAVFKIESGFDITLSHSLKILRANQPKEPSAGSCFKNPKDDFAGRLIESVGLRGYSHNGIAFSEKHSNFLVNLSEAKFEDAIHIIEIAKKRVFEKFGVLLEQEIVIL
jgi:UDP-N-acetylmuramate dehydrogenase